jgi:dolichyl-phosphate beta-glucosyltransferase
LNTLDVTVVIPAYNEQRRIVPTLEKIRDYAQSTDSTWELIVVNDGSDDATTDCVQQFDAGALQVQVIMNDTNRGKGYSVRRGMLHASGSVVLMCDADMSTPIEEIQKLRPFVTQGFDVVIGSRDVADSVLDPPQPLHRRVMAWVFRNIRRCIMLRQVYDTQCGFKLFTREAAQQVFTVQKEDGFAFDVEALAIAQALGYRIKEVGVTWRDDRDSRVRPVRDGLNVFWQVLRIARRVKRLQKS